MPTQERIVLSIANGHVFAILETPSSLSGICSSQGCRTGRGRAKINMKSGKITQLTVN